MVIGGLCMRRRYTLTYIAFGALRKGWDRTKDYSRAATGSLVTV